MGRLSRSSTCRMGCFALVFVYFWCSSCTQPKGKADSDAQVHDRSKELLHSAGAKSIDLGKWEPQDSHTQAKLRRVHFADDQCGWVVGDHGTVLYTRDGGQSWAQRAISTDYDLIDTHFIDCSAGWVVGINQTLSPSRSRLWHTTDAGLTWSESRLDIREIILGIDFSGSEHGWLFGRGSIKHHDYLEEYGVVGRSTDGGRSWSFSNLPSGPIDKNGPVFGLWLTGPSHGWAMGSLVIRHTTDGGTTWKLQYEQKYDPTKAYGFGSIWFIDDTTGWASGYQDGDMGYFTGIVRTTDGGRTWTESQSQEPLMSLRFLDANVGVGVGAARPVGYMGNPGGSPRRDGIIMLTTDSGESWSEEYRVNDRRLLHVFVSKSGQCWSVGERGAIIHWVAQLRN